MFTYPISNLAQCGHFLAPSKEYYEIYGVAAEAGGGDGAGVSVTRVAAAGSAGEASWSGTPAAR